MCSGDTNAQVMLNVKHEFGMRLLHVIFDLKDELMGIIVLLLIYYGKTNLFCGPIISFSLVNAFKVSECF